MVNDAKLSALSSKRSALSYKLFGDWSPYIIHLIKGAIRRLVLASLTLQEIAYLGHT